jgi:hypothetical protein
MRLPSASDGKGTVLARLGEEEEAEEPARSSFIFDIGLSQA